MEIFFTSGATEAIAMALQVYCSHEAGKKTAIITSPMEHDAVLDTCRRLLNMSHVTTNKLANNSDGKVYFGEVKTILKESSRAIISLMLANNEIGTVNPLHELKVRKEQFKAVVFSDITQALGNMINTIDEDGFFIDNLEMDEVTEGIEKNVSDFAVYT